MERPARARPEPRTPLWRDRILLAALAHADAGGLDTLTMRELARSLGVAPMSLYRHVANKEDLIDGIVDLVFREIALPPTEVDWKTAMRLRGLALHDALARHPWAIGLMEARANPGPANLRHHDAVIGCLRAAGFDIAMTAHIYSVLDGFIYGFALTRMNLPFDAADIAAVSRSMLEPFPLDEYPHLAEMLMDHVLQPGYEYANEFEFGLDLILDGLGRLRNIETVSASPRRGPRRR